MIQHSNMVFTYQVSVGDKTYKVEVDANYSTLYEDGVAKSRVLSTYFIKSIDPWPLDFDECDTVGRATRDILHGTLEGREATERWEPYDETF